MSYFLSVDCGGSKTAAAIADATGTIVARGTGGPSNFAYLGLANFLSAVESTVNAALATLSQPHLPPLPSAPIFASAWFGVSGVDSAAAVATLIPPLTALLGVVPVVANDTHLLAAPLRIHHDVSTAIGLVSGTGGIVVSFRQREDGQLEELGRVGGWGWILGDEGGGFHVGREAVRQILWAADNASVLAPEERAAATQSTLRTRVLARFGITDPFEVLTAVHWPDPLPGAVHAEGAPEYTRIVREKRLSSLAPLVFAAAFEDGDALALRVLDITTKMLVDQLSVLLRPEVDGPDAPYAARKIKASETVLCFGGSLVGVEKYRNMILDELAVRGHVMKRVEFVDDAAAVGAKALAAGAKQGS